MNRYDAITEEQKEEIKFCFFKLGLGADATARRVGCCRNSVRKTLNKEPPAVWYEYWGQVSEEMN